MSIKRISKALAGLALLALAGCASSGEPIAIDAYIPKPVYAGQAASTTAAPAATARSEHVAMVRVTPENYVHLVIHTHNRKWPNWMLATDQLVLDYITSDDSAINTAAAIKSVEDACHLYTTTSRPNEAVAVILNGMVYATTEAPFAALGASAFKGANLLQYTQYGSSAEAGGGIGSGIIQMGGKVYTFTNCGKMMFEQLANQNFDFHITIIEPSTY